MAKLIDTLGEFSSVSLPGFPRLVINEELTDVDLEALAKAVKNAWGDRMVVVEDEPPVVAEPVAVEPVAEPVSIAVEAPAPVEPVAEPVPEPVAEQPVSESAPKYPGKKRS